MRIGGGVDQLDRQQGIGWQRHAFQGVHVATDAGKRRGLCRGRECDDEEG